MSIPALTARAIAVALGLLALASPPRADEGGDAPRDFAALWREAERWASETGAAAHECVFTFRFDPRTRRLRDGHAAACDEPYRSPFYPWPAPSRPGVRFTVDDVERHGGEIGRGSPRPALAAAMADEPLEACGLVVGFTAEGQGAEAIECYRPQDNVLGQRANTQFVVGAPGGERVVSRLYERIAHLGDGLVREMYPPPRPSAAAAAMRIEGKVIGRKEHRLLIRGRALPSAPASASAPGVLRSEASIVVAYPSDDALRPGYYRGGVHCFADRRDVVSAQGRRTAEWVYGPCPLGPGHYWVFEHHPLGKRTLWHGPYGDYGACDAARRALRSTQLGVGGHCLAKSGAMLRMRQDGSLVVPSDAPPFR
jgi:hypothetical protein